MPEISDPRTEAAEGRTNNWGEVVTRQPYRKVRLDHLLSKDKVRVVIYCLVIKAVKSLIMISGGDALGGNTRSHPEHDG